jgi:superfamily II DNA helicase RecQ
MVDTPSPAPVTAFHLDEMKLKSVHKLKRILRDERSKRTAVIIYTSPQALNGVKGAAIIPFLLRRNLIRLVVLDEIHLITSFGHTFRKEFGTLPATLFSKLNIDCPMLFLTATCTAAIRRDFESLMQLEINQWQWPSPNEMMHRCVSINAQYTTKPFQHVMKTFKSMISNSPSESNPDADSVSSSNLPTKVIVYSNTRERILNFAESIKKKMNADKVLKDIDIISLVGTLTKQEKTELIRLFVNGSRKHQDLKLRLLCATSGVGNAGIDCPDVRAVYRIDFPPSILDLAQEKGRAGRRPGSTPDDFHYTLCYSLETYLYLFKRILDPSEQYVNESYRDTQIQQLLEVAKVLITPQSCIPFSLEHLMGRPDCTDAHDVPVCGACTNCIQKKSQFEPVSRQGLTKILLDLFISSSEDMVFTMDNTVKYIK